MKPLRDTEHGSPLLERAKTLLDAAEPLPESRERMLRVRRALDQRRGGLLVSLRRLPAAAMAALIVLFGASAFAAVRVFVAVRSEALESSVSTPPADASHKRGKKVARPSAAPTVAAEVEAIGTTPAATELPAPSAPTAPSEATTTSTSTPTSDAASATGSTRAASKASGTKGHGTHRASSGATRTEHETSPEALARATDSELVHRAAKALRSEHDPALAARLLEVHRARSPAGPLAEEALSLQIEALSALGSPRAASHAREYLARYPGGRYTAVAKGALPDPAP